jgi:hypothetical protein
MQREQPGAIGADTEERGVAERYDPGVAQDQIERQCEQRDGNSNAPASTRSQNAISLQRQRACCKA